MFAPIRVLANLHAAQMQTAFELFDRALNRPSDGIWVQDRARTGLKEIGHDNVDASQPVLLQKILPSVNS